MKDVEKERTDAYAALRTQVAQMGKTSEKLQQDTSQLVAALRAPQTRGAWGEHQLRQVVEFAGMIEHCDFGEQQSVSTADGMLRPDLIVNLAGGKHVVVDAKVSLVGFLDAMAIDDAAADAATTAATRAHHLKRHARHLRDHIDHLGAKAYWDLLPNTPEFVVMFIPAETFLSAALEQDPALWQYGFEKNVIMATPATLIGLLRTVGYSWRQEALAANAHDVLTLGRELYSRLSTMGIHIEQARHQTELRRAELQRDRRVPRNPRVHDRPQACRPEGDKRGVGSATTDRARRRKLQRSELVASANDSLVSLPAPQPQLLFEPSPFDPSEHAAG